MTDQIFDVRLDDITIPKDRARSLDAAWADGLARIIDEQGLTNPITVRKVDGEIGYRLVTGLHRAAAVQRNGETHIAARLSTASNDDEARLEEVMENLGRHELKALDRCRHLFELKRVYEKLHPEATHGGDRKSEQIKRKSLPLDQKAEQNLEFFGFSEDTAKTIGLNARTIRLAVKIWKDLTPDSRSRLVGTALATKQTELKLLSEQTRTTQAKVLDLVLEAENGIDGVQPALDRIADGVPMSPSQKKMTALNKTIGRLDDMVLDAVVAANAERMIAALKRLGRI